MELLERDLVLGALDEYATDSEGGTGRVVFMAGEAGMGKTAVLEEFRKRRSADRWLWGACDGLFTPRPLGPLFDIAAQIGGAFYEQVLNGASREEIFSGLLSLIEIPDATTIVAIEDVHWADEATLDLIRFLARRVGRARTLLLVTYRDDELGERHPLRRVIGDLVSERSFRRIDLAPLSVEAIRSLGGRLDIDATRLYELTGGNPFYVTEVLETGTAAIPSSVRDAVLSRVSRLGPEARAVLEAAGVIGARVEHTLLEKVVGAPPAIDECLSSGALVDEDNSYLFRHELTRMAVEDSIPPQRKADLHARVLRALESNGRVDDARMAHHAAGAGDAAAVLRYAPAAAAKASDLGAHLEASDHYERALRFADEQEPSARAMFYERLAQERYLTDQQSESVAACRAAMDLRREIEDLRGLGDDLVTLSRSLWRLCEGEEALAAVDQAIRVLEPLPQGRELAWAYAFRGAFSNEEAAFDESIDWSGRARDLAEGVGDPEVLSYALNTLGCARVASGEAEGWGDLERALTIGLESGLQQSAGRAYANLHALADDFGRPGDAERYFAEGIAYCEDRDIDVYTTCLWGGRGVVLLHQGRWHEAEAVAIESLERRVVSPINRLNPLMTIGLLRARRGQPDAWLILDELRELSEATEELSYIAVGRIARAEAFWLEGHFDDAAAEIEPIFEAAVASKDGWMSGPIAVWLARCGREIGVLDGLPTPFELELAGKYEEAEDAWATIGRTYEGAMALASSEDPPLLRRALEALQSLGAEAAAAAVVRKMKTLGIKAVPRGPRSTTKAHPFKLTMREQEILDLLSEGLANNEISERLVISEKTVDHHVSAVLSKMGVRSRAAAVREAGRAGLLAAK